MQNSRRHFIKTAGVGLAGLGFALSPVSQLLAAAPGGFFPHASPESQGVSSKGILAFVEAANASGISWHSFMLLRHGKVVAEGWWNPFAQEFVHSLYSLSKSFTSTAIGFLVKEGKLDINTPVISFFPKEVPANPSENLQAMTVKNLLTMNTGHETDTMPVMGSSTKPWTQAFLEHPVVFKPGTHFLYNTGATYMLGAILHTITGQTLEQYLAPRLFQPLEITGYDWETSPQGLNTAGYGLRVKTEDIAKLGQLYLQQGQWMGKELLPASWVKDATSHQTDSQVNNGDWSQGYGYQFWRCTHNAFRGDGAFGQYCIVMPDKDAVLAVTSQTPDMQKSLNIIWEHLLPALQDGSLPEDARAASTLKKTLSSLSLPVVKGSTTSSLFQHIHMRQWLADKNDLHAYSLQFAFSRSGCTLTTKTDTDTVTLNFGWEKWELNKARQLYAFPEGNLNKAPTRVAGTATWINDSTLQLNLRFVETFHGDRMQCVFNGDQLSVSFMSSVAENSKEKMDSRKPLRAVLQG
ncbi:serine hydrolase [Chitinophaga agrisoli]|uniref:Serine hydrolase n=1 Tax=Chitinophaga agrisoli TaxID=2607653 RepID=A0A5B2W5V3_9BACT|nr:serine hydrolase [Chitinophaga agrisoli]KAA2245757.1 serine hydrolase [Chitinophaga agrisoli]